MLKSKQKQIEALGLAALVVGLLSYIPLVLNVHITKKTNNFPFLMLFFAILASLLWIIYGLFMDYISLQLSASISLAIYFYILYMKIKY